MHRVVAKRAAILIWMNNGSGRTPEPVCDMDQLILAALGSRLHRFFPLPVALELTICRGRGKGGEGVPRQGGWEERVG
jgi:hypothetical protein